MRVFRLSARETAFPDALPPLTSLRFFLALGVVLFHFQLQWTLGPYAVGALDRLAHDRHVFDDLDAAVEHARAHVVRALAGAV